MSKKKILIVENEESILNLLGVLLTSRGYAVQEASNGQAALDSIAEDPPDLVLLAIMLLGVDGFEVCRRIKGESASKHIPVIVLSAKKDPKSIDMVKTVGADWFVSKPFKCTILFEAIQKFLNK